MLFGGGCCCLACIGQFRRPRPGLLAAPSGQARPSGGQGGVVDVRCPQPDQRIARRAQCRPGGGDVGFGLLCCRLRGAELRTRDAYRGGGLVRGLVKLVSCPQAGAELRERRRQVFIDDGGRRRVGLVIDESRNSCRASPASGPPSTSARAAARRVLRSATDFSSDSALASVTPAAFTFSRASSTARSASSRRAFASSISSACEAEGSISTVCSQSGHGCPSTRWGRRSAMTCARRISSINRWHSRCRSSAEASAVSAADHPEWARSRPSRADPRSVMRSCRSRTSRDACCSTASATAESRAVRAAVSACSASRRACAALVTASAAVRRCSSSRFASSGTETEVRAVCSVPSRSTRCLAASAPRAASSRWPRSSSRLAEAVSTLDEASPDRDDSRAAFSCRDRRRDMRSLRSAR